MYKILPRELFFEAKTTQPIRSRQHFKYGRKSSIQRERFLRSLGSWKCTMVLNLEILYHQIIANLP